MTENNTVRITSFQKHKRSIISWTKYLLTSFVLAWMFRVLVAQSYTVATDSMNDALLQGDRVMVNKIKYGTRLPITVFSVPFTQTLYFDWLQLPVWRLPGFSKVKRYDIVAFNNPLETKKPIDKRSIFAKRIVGLPGDTIEINDKILYNNKLKAEIIGQTKSFYRMITSDTTLSQKLLNKFKIKEIYKVSGCGLYYLNISDKTASKLTKEKGVSQLTKFTSEKYAEHSTLYPKSKLFHWTADYYGPLIVPESGLTVKLNEENLTLYRLIIEKYENNELEIKNGKVVLNGKETNKYTFKDDYFFVLNDLRDNTNDSRSMGFIPSNHLIGQVSLVWYSSDKNNMPRWKKMFRFVQ